MLRYSYSTQLLPLAFRILISFGTDGVNKLPQKFKGLVVRFTRAVTALICFIVAWFGLKFVLDEYEYGGIAFGIIPDWLCEAIIPFSFCIMAVRYAISALSIDLAETRR